MEYTDRIGCRPADPADAVCVKLSPSLQMNADILQLFQASLLPDARSLPGQKKVPTAAASELFGGRDDFLLCTLDIDG